MRGVPPARTRLRVPLPGASSETAAISSAVHILHTDRHGKYWSYAPGNFIVQRHEGATFIIAGFIYGYDANGAALYAVKYFVIASDNQGLATLECSGQKRQFTYWDSGINPASLTQGWLKKARKAKCI